MNQLRAGHPMWRRALTDTAAVLFGLVAAVAAILLLQAWPHLTVASRLACAGITAAVVAGYAFRHGRHDARHR